MKSLESRSRDGGYFQSNFLLARRQDSNTIVTRQSATVPTTGDRESEIPKVPGPPNYTIAGHSCVGWSHVKVRGAASASSDFFVPRPCIRCNRLR